MRYVVYGKRPGVTDTSSDVIYANIQTSSSSSLQYNPTTHQPKLTLGCGTLQQAMALGTKLLRHELLDTVEIATWNSDTDPVILPNAQLVLDALKGRDT